MMYLKEIEIQGFKSFADRTKVSFDRGVTAVVGPNGSGKSNITESLRWALGESSAKSLRGGKMPDVIFAGTEGRQALNFAQVTVTLDNSDGFIDKAEEVIKVERRIYRNGDSDYLIDGKKVRLRDIHDLFMDTGLGKDSFSIISQGRVEAIFNAKPEERRTIFEEAAGVLKYKTRKKETQVKLEQTQGNLNRVEDIIFELEKQVDPLAAQASKAKQFLSLNEKHQELQLSVLVEDIDHHKKELDQVQVDLIAAQKDLDSYYQERHNLENQNQQLKAERQQITQALQEKQDDMMRLTNLSADLDQKISLTQLQSDQSKEREEETKKQLIALQKNQEKLIKQKAAVQKDLKDLTDKSKALKQEVHDLEEKLQAFSQDPEQVIESLREQYVTLLQKEADSSNQLTQLLADIERLEEQNQSQTKEAKQLKAEYLRQQELLQNAENAHKEAIEQVENLLSNYQEKVQAIEHLELSYKNKQDRLFALIDDVKAKEARKASLESIQKNHSNFYAGVKVILQAGEQLGGIIGAVSEHLSFESRYQVAMEVALGGSAQHIIVEDETTAKSAIAFLKQKRAGRATFLPLTTIKPRQLSEYQINQLSSSSGFLGVASDLVGFDDSLKAIFQNLLGTTAIFETIDQATEAARTLSYKVRIITLDGTELRPGGAYAGGAQRQGQSIFIKLELDQLQAELNQLAPSLSQLENDVKTDYEMLVAQKNELDQLKKAGEEARFLENKNLLTYQQAKQQLDDLKQLLTQVTTEFNQENLSVFKTRQVALEKNLQELLEKKSQLQARIDQVKADKEEIGLEKSRFQLLLSEKQLLQREWTAEKRHLASSLTRLEGEELSLSQTILDLKAKLGGHQQFLPQESITKLKSQLGHVNSQKKQLNQDIIRQRFELEDLEARLEEIDGKTQKLSKTNEVYIRRQANLESQVESLTANLQTFSAQLSQEYSLSFSEAKNTAKKINNLELARQELQDLQSQIKNLGPVNTDAIAQYDDVNSRLDFLMGQKNDLVDAKNMILDTIHDMDDEVKERFHTTFEAVRHSFRETFKQMFGGGSADLVLTEGDLLTAGVDISVQPPGKKIQSINLMSGGEKALSALALLFAIIRVKTIPFVVLDEVEAALDEANVKRFGDYLNRFDKNSQFIVVTHRKGTMAAADTIYGVTMQESGVSKVLSVKLKEAEQLSQ